MYGQCYTFCCPSGLPLGGSEVPEVVVSTPAMAGSEIHQQLPCRRPNTAVTSASLSSICLGCRQGGRRFQQLSCRFRNGCDDISSCRPVCNGNKLVRNGRVSQPGRRPAWAARRWPEVPQQPSSIRNALQRDLPALSPAPAMAAALASVSLCRRLPGC
jgi:hypothetical protein